MIDKLTSSLDFNGNALMLRAERQRVLASNIANVDTPGYQARDFRCSKALQEAGSNTLTPARPAMLTSSTSSNAAFIPLDSNDFSNGGKPTMAYAVPAQPSGDGNTVDLDRERAAFADNAIRYEATLRFISGQVKTMLSAIQGQ